ncbi:Avirulence (Avh) protein [Phytophthora megakarya]|uniref:RxLR effector protein n=1 Tax=Phytophthora megakarya TaxID=4795 RepID=A0A225VJ66_9STRA|nr:Avirulence (Avh) protein [Phytophthora megakarya]
MGLINKLVVIAVTYCAICNATVDSNHANVSMMKSADSPSETQINDTSDKRLLRAHPVIEEDDNEERGFTFNIAAIFEKANAKAMVKKIIDRPDLHDEIFQAWRSKKFSLSSIDEFLSLAGHKDTATYNTIYNGYKNYLDK